MEFGVHHVIEVRRFQLLVHLDLTVVQAPLCFLLFHLQHSIRRLEYLQTQLESLPILQLIPGIANHTIYSTKIQFFRVSQVMELSRLERFGTHQVRLVEFAGPMAAGQLVSHPG
jgi:hypothetical protein